MVVLRMGMIVFFQSYSKSPANKHYNDLPEKCDFMLIAPEWVGKEEDQGRDSDDGLQQKLDESLQCFHGTGF